jgi:hypothetical protein
MGIEAFEHEKRNETLPEGFPKITVVHDKRSEQAKEEEEDTMRAITLESFDSSPGLHEVPTPQIAPNGLSCTIEDGRVEKTRRHHGNEQ